ncbi:MAG: lactate utilization protein [Candidatus Hydrogenedentes bacterium]|nr:lactate utilization protein [Candidatus Hydrogenedentota bacterium]
MGSNPAVVEMFSRAFETVAGIAHTARTDADIAHIVGTIAREKQARRIALAGLDTGVAAAIVAECSGIEVLSQPYPADTLPAAIDQAQVGVTGISFGIAQTGTLVEVSTNDAVRLVSALPRTHIGIVRASELVECYEDAAPRIRALFAENPAACVVSFMSGPSRTGDIELKLTLGVHGPESAHAIVVLD